MNAVIEEKETISLIAALIATQFGLAPTRVFIYNQKWKIPPGEGLFVEVAMNAQKPYGSSTGFEDIPQTADAPAKLIENQVTSMQEVYTVTLYSRNGDARRMQPRLLMALASVASQQVQEKYSFQVGRLPISFVDVSSTEGAARLNKYAYTFALLRSYSQSFIVDYFDKFQFPNLVINP